jgi:hypothetical protein
MHDAIAALAGTTASTVALEDRAVLSLRQLAMRGVRGLAAVLLGTCEMRERAEHLGTAVRRVRTVVLTRATQGGHVELERVIRVHLVVHEILQIMPILESQRWGETLKLSWDRFASQSLVM